MPVRMAIVTTLKKKEKRKQMLKRTWRREPLETKDWIINGSLAAMENDTEGPQKK